MSPVNDPIGDLLTRMRNAQSARRQTCRAPWSRLTQSLCEILKRDGWVADVRVTGESLRQELEISFAPDHSRLALTRVSKPGRRVYAGFTLLKPVLQGFGFAVLTTSQGLMTDAEAREKKIGGEVLCTVS